MRLSRRIGSVLLAAACCFGSALPLRAAGAAPPAQDSRTVVEKLYRAIDAGDLRTVVGLIADRATWTYYGPEYILPFAGTFHGPRGVGEFFRIVDETLTESRAEQRDYLISSNKVIVPGWEESTVKSTGARYRVDNLHLFTIQQGKITKFEAFVNSSDIVEGFLPADPARGEALFTTCAGCHGGNAEGSPEMHAPNLAGLGNSYLVRQLRNFRSGRRGNTLDEHGFMMIGRANALPGDRGVRDVAAYISKLPSFNAPASVEGDVRRGRKLYETCAACHGTRAEGDEKTSAPPLRQLDDRYMVSQLEKFASGVRGSAAEDRLGQQMRASVSVLPDAAAIRDVISYLKSL
jgi:cytochrome c553